jgi:hypothetical protein
VTGSKGNEEERRSGGGAGGGRTPARRCRASCGRGSRSPRVRPHCRFKDRGATSAYDAAGVFSTFEYLRTLERKILIFPGGMVPVSPKRIAGSAQLCGIAHPGEARVAARRRWLRRGTGGARSVEGRKLGARDSCAGRDTGQPLGVGSSGSCMTAPQGVCGAREYEGLGRRTRGRRGGCVCRVWAGLAACAQSGRARCVWSYRHPLSDRSGGERETFPMAHASPNAS